MSPPGSRWPATSCSPARARSSWPAAASGLVLLPFMSQWVAVLDGQNGHELGRVRSTEEQVSFVRAGSDGLFYGGASGIFALDERAAAGSRKGSTYGAAKYPGDFIR